MTLGELLNALNTGHEGGAGTVHANSPAELPARLEALGALGGLGRPALHSQLAAAVSVVLHLRRQPDGGRVLSEIALLRPVNGLVVPVPAWRWGTGRVGHELVELLASRGVSAPGAHRHAGPTALPVTRRARSGLGGPPCQPAHLVRDGSV